MNKYEKIFRERPIGSKANNQLIEFLGNEMIRLGYKVNVLPLKCRVWEKGLSSLERGMVSFDIFPGPFSQGFEGEVHYLIPVSTLEELKNSDILGKLVLLHGEISSEPLMPKDFPFYYPDDHKAVIDLLEEKKPLAVIAATGAHPMCGLKPFPMFEDGNLPFPHAYMDQDAAKILMSMKGPVSLILNSQTKEADSKQLIARKGNQGKKKIIVCAHMDTKYGTPGALDNGSGVLALLEIMALLKDYQGRHVLEFVHFNGEEYFEVAGQLAYLDQQAISFETISLLINLDGIGHKAGKTAVSLYNLNDETPIDQVIASYPRITRGPVWYAGDHSMFAFQGISCMALTSSNLYEDVLQLTHTPDDIPENLDFDLISETAAFVAEVIRSIN